MILDKEIRSQVLQNYLLVSGLLNIDSTYFIKKIEDSIINSKFNFVTNVKGYMTPWDYFVGDDNFLKTIIPILDKLDEYKLLRYELNEAWGLKEEWAHYTKEHNHLPAYLSGVLYLNDHPQELIFTDINISITPEKGRFVVFSSFLNHKTKRNRTDIPKYAISFNCANRDFV